VGLLCYEHMFAHRISALWVVVFAVLALAFSSARAAGGSSEAGARHVVRSGDTLWQIASDHYDGDPRGAVWRIQERNGLTSPTLVPGMTLYLPP
jgi:nucleoid-associated protein YgaU